MGCVRLIHSYDPFGVINTMKYMNKVLLSAVFAAGLMMALPAQAEPKPTIWGWWPSHWQNMDFEPYLENGKDPHNTQWDRKIWKPADWVAQKGSTQDLLKGFYSAEILSDQYVDDDVPVLEVGPNFYHLSGFDKRRVARTVDEVYQITSSKPDGMFMLYDWRTKKAVGIYTAHGLQIQ